MTTSTDTFGIRRHRDNGTASWVTSKGKPWTTESAEEARAKADRMNTDETVPGVTYMAETRNPAGKKVAKAAGKKNGRHALAETTIPADEAAAVEVDEAAALEAQAATRPRIEFSTADLRAKWVRTGKGTWRIDLAGGAWIMLAKSPEGWTAEVGHKSSDHIGRGGPADSFTRAVRIAEANYNAQ